MTDTNKTESKSDKFNRAVDRARNGEAPATTSAAPSMPAGPLVRKIDDAELAAMLAEQGYEYAPQVKSLEEGERVSGILEGNGPEATFEHHDKVTGEATMTTVQTWIIASPDGAQRISILSSAQLDRKLPPFVGGPVDIVRGKDQKTSSGFRVTDYLVRGPRLKDGSRRNFVQPPKMIDATAAQAALPAGAPDPTQAEPLA